VIRNICDLDMEPATRWDEIKLILRDRWPRVFRRFIVRWVPVPQGRK
jgi:hypothetical protein